MLSDELVRRGLKDQELRFGIQNPKNTTVTWAEIKRIDKDNTAWLKSVIKKKGWPTISKVGEEASHAAWLIIQHADLDVNFQEDCLELLRKAWDNNDINQRNLAYLTDRVAVNKGLKQVYGTQFHKNKKGKIIPWPIKERGGLDRRRTKMGLEPFKIYEKRMNGEYLQNQETEKLGEFYISK